MAAPKAILFDVFGTVVNYEGSVTRHIEAFLAAHSDLQPGPTFSCLGFTQRWRAGYRRRTREIAHGAPGPSDVDELHRELLDALITSDYPVFEGLSEKARSDWVQFWHQLDGWPDAATALAQLHRLDPPVLTATLSNGSARLLVDLNRYSDLRFDAVFSGDLIGSYKPSKAMYETACRLLGLQMEEVAMFASHIYDLRAASSFGMKTIYIKRETEDTDLTEPIKSKAEGGEVDFVVKSMADLPALVENWSITH